MNTIMIASTTAYSGKSGICLAMLKELADAGHDVAYFKPFGTMPVMIDDVQTDEDAVYLREQATVKASLADVCPVVRSRRLLEDVLSGRAENLGDVVSESFERVSAAADTVVVEGPSDIDQGRTAGLSLCDLAGRLDAKVLLVHKPVAEDLPDEILFVADCLGDRLAGIVFNAVRESVQDFYAGPVTDFLENAGVRVFGVIDHDPLLSSASVHEIVDALSGTVLCADEKLDAAVETFMVGAMGQDKALRFFRRKNHKAVITGGDRADVQLAALETDTRCIILTGNLPPSSLVLSRAEELGVPMVLVGMDTLSAVEKMEALLGRIRLHDPVKADRIRAMFAAAVNTDEVLASLR